MFEHVADRAYASRWLSTLFLFAVALAWFFATMAHRVGDSRVSLGTTLAVAVGVSGLRVGVMLIGRRRRERKADREAAGGAAETDLAEPEDESAAEDHRPTYEDVFGASAEADQPSEQNESAADGDADGTSDQPEGWHAESDDTSGEIEAVDGEADGIGGELEAGHTDDEQMSEPLEQLDAEIGEASADQASADVEAIKSELESEEAIRRLREEFRARAREAQLRIEQREAELHDAATAPTSG
jgi:hypothetical protein